MKLRGKSYSVTGPVRTANEDLVQIDDQRQIYLLADGMGGHVGGAKASQLSVETVANILGDSFDPDAQASSVQDIDRWEKYLRDAISSASQVVHKLAKEDSKLHGMGSTLTTLVHRDGNGILGHVGDSRLYLYRGGVLHQLTHDHTITAQLLAEGRISPAEVNSHRYRNVLTKAVGVYEGVEADTLVFELALGDHLLMCSDGFYDLFDDHDALLKFVSDNIKADFVPALEKIIEERQASDNVSVVFLDVVPDDKNAEAETSHSQEVVLKVEILKEVNLFQQLDMKDVVALVQSGFVHRLEAGADIVLEGENPASSLYVILEGEVEILKGGARIAKLKKGNHFGEMSLLLDAPRSASVKALTDLSLIELPKTVIEQFLQRTPRGGIEFLLAMSREFAERLSEANKRTE
ncbi:MAG: cyclic nucleotide-binding domain-containing protein [Bdellovibrionales bacterium]|nr:cyclic nucleotide-binding domain-containing protein [Bdellovibrionales bacterium]